MKAAENQDFISQGSTNVRPSNSTHLPRPLPADACPALARDQNATCFLGPYRKYDPFTKSFMSLVPGQGQCAAALKPPTPRLSRARHSPSSSLAQLRPRRHSRRCALATRGERVAQGARTHHALASHSHADARWPRFRRRRATPWSRSSLRSTRRWPTRRVKRASPEAHPLRALRPPSPLIATTRAATSILVYPCACVC